MDNLPPRDLNLIIFPDWKQDEASLTAALERVIAAMALHLERDRTTLWVDACDLNAEDAGLLFSAAVMKLLLEGGVEGAEKVQIALLEDSYELEEESFQQHLHGRIILPLENPQRIPSTLAALELESLSQLPAVQLFLARGEDLFRTHQWQAASEEYEKVLAREPGEPQLYFNLAECYRYLDRSERRLETLKRGSEVYPLEPRFYFTAIVHLQREGRAEEGIELARTACDRIPNDYTFKLLKNLFVPAIYQYPHEIAEARQRFTVGLETLIEGTRLETAEERHNVLTSLMRLTNFYISYQAQNDVELQKKYGEFLHRVVSSCYPQWNQPLILPEVEEGGKIRIGYVSAYLHSYSGTLWLTGWLKYADRERFEIYCYYTGNSPDLITDQFQEYSDFFHHFPYNIEATAQQIREDNLHLLIYPELGMDAPILTMAGLRLAPIQCTAWGHPVTTGLPTIDYFLSSELMEAEEAEKHYSETLIRLPHIGVAYPKPHLPPLIKNRSDYGLPEDAILYLCCQAPFKYLPQYDYLLAEIARQVPQAQFIFLRGKLLQPRLDRAFSALGLNYTDYCLFLTLPERLDYLLINLLSDVYLDTITWSGGNTSLEAIACHLPLVTCTGEFMRGRHTDSFLKRIGVTETIAKNEGEYLQIAVKLGQAPTWRAAIKEQMKQQCDRLYDDRVCVRGLEDFFTHITEQKSSHF